MTRLAEVKAQLEEVKRDRDRHWLALSDVLAGRVADTLVFSIPGERVELLLLARVCPIVIVKRKVKQPDGTWSIDVYVHDYERLRAEVREWSYAKADKVHFSNILEHFARTLQARGIS